MLARPSMAIVASLVLILLNVRPVSAVTPDFSARRNFGTGAGHTLSVAVGDMDGDGDLDIITGNDDKEQNAVYLNDGAGNFTTARNFGTGSDITRIVAVGDMDGDGDLDIIAGNDFGQQSVVYLNDGEGTFTTTRNFGTGSDNTSGVAAGDMDGDGDLDIITGNYQQQSVVYLNDGAGNFTAGSTFGMDSSTITTVAVGDMDGDGNLDIITGNYQQQNVVYLNDGGGNFTSARNLGTGVDHTLSVAVGDMEGDGDLDIITGNFEQQNVVYLNDGGGNFTSARNFGTGMDNSQSVAAGDMDGDGALDIITGNYQQQNVVYLNDGGGNFTTGSNFGPGSDDTQSVAAGDMDGDGDLDIIMGNFKRQSVVYLNDGGGNFTAARNFGTGTDYTTSVAAGDMDGDGDLDIITGNDGQNVVYLNDGAGNFTAARNFGPDGVKTYSVAVGDMDGDGDLDIITGDAFQQNVVYLNDGGGNFTAARNFGTGGDNTSGVAAGDMDGDGDLDIITGSYGQQSRVYLNDGGGNFASARNFGTGSDSTWSVAVGDMEGDGDLDISTGNDGQNVVYLNDGAGNFTAARNFGTGGDTTNSVAVGDMDGDGDLDIITGNFDIFSNRGQNIAYLNDGGGNFTAARNFGTGTDATNSVAAGDMDGDGDLDLAAGNNGEQNVVYLNDGAGNPHTHVVLARPVATKNANFYSTPISLSNNQIALSYQLIDAESDLVGGIKVQFSLDGGGRWLPAVGAPGTQTANLATSPSGVEHVYTWDTFASGFFGQSDNVVVRLVAYAQPAQPVALGTYRYKNQVAGPFQYAYVATQTFPFRVRGTQVQVVDEANPPQALSQALVYRLPDGQARNAQPYSDGGSRPYGTNGQGYLQGRGEMGGGDGLAALWPVAAADLITFTQSYTFYLTSASPTTTALDLKRVDPSQPGVQVLTVSGDNKLLLINLDVALEWDARKDVQFMEGLKFNLQRTSDLLFDWTNGQAALGQVRIFQDAKRYPAESGINPWEESHIRIYASNRVRPNAAVGGIISPTLVLTETVTLNGQPKEIEYDAGQVHMGAIWNRYGETNGNLGDDWARALAHELGHYVFFLEDNYLGLDEHGLLVTVKADGVDGCPGVMNDPYRDDQSEFHPLTGWDSPGCQNTLSQRSTGRADWQSIEKFYHLNQPSESFSGMNQGPNIQPLAVTQLQEFSPTVAVDTLDVPIFTLLKGASEGGGTYLPGPNAQAFLFQGEWLTDLGQPTLDQLQAWGARGGKGDRLCLLEPGLGYYGCEQVQSGDAQLVVEKQQVWQPEIVVSSVTSYTIAISGMVPLEGGSQLCGRLYPVDEAAQAGELVAAAAGVYAHTFAATTTPTLEGYVHVWTAPTGSSCATEPSGAASLETVTSYAVGGNPIHRRARRTFSRGGGVHRRARRVPVISADGQVLIFGDVLDAANDEEEWSFTLQAIPTSLGLPPGRTLVGQAYRLTASATAPDLTGTSISFGYLGEQVPPGEEGFLRIYFWQQDAAACQPLSQSAPCWQPLDTFRDTEYNVASAKTQGVGLYALMASLEIPLTGPAWNLISYPVPYTQTVPSALASLAGHYSIVYGHRPDQPDNPWAVYSPTAPEWANDLKQMEFGRGYFIYATDTISLYLSSEPTVQAATAGGLILPPAVIYGVVQPVGDFNPTPGMEVTAWIGDKLCGRSQVQIQGDQQVYVVKVAADDGGSFSGCGIQGRVVRIQIGETVTAAQTAWDNTRTVDTSAAQHLIFLPLTSR